MTMVASGKSTEKAAIKTASSRSKVQGDQPTTLEIERCAAEVYGLMFNRGIESSQQVNMSTCEDSISDEIKVKTRFVQKQYFTVHVFRVAAHENEHHHKIDHTLKYHP